MTVIDSGSLSRPGQVNQAGDERANFLILASGLVLASFEEMSDLNRYMIRKPLTHGKSADFPAFGKTTAGFHVTGNHIYQDGEVGVINTVKRRIELDDLLIAGTFIDELDLLRLEYEIISPYTGIIGEALATTYDQYGYQALTRAARTNSTNSATLVPTDMGTRGSGGFVGSVDLTAGGSTAGAALLTALFAAQQLLTEKSVPKNPRWAPLKPAHYNYLTRDRTLLDRDFGNEGNGVFYNGTIFVAAGFGLFETIHLPTTNITTNPSGANNTYTGNFTELHTTVFHESAVGALWLMAPNAQTEYDMDYQGWKLLARMIQGIGPVRYESAVEISAAASQPAL